MPKIISIKGIDIDRKYNYDYLYKDGENFKESCPSSAACLFIYDNLPDG